MITCYSRSTRQPTAGDLSQTLLSGDVIWVDMLTPTPMEVSQVQEAVGIVLPALALLNEIEHSSRMRRDGRAIVLSLPTSPRTALGAKLVPIGFILIPELLVTIRFTADGAINEFARKFSVEARPDLSGASVMIGIFEALVDEIADRLEELEHSIDGMAECELVAPKAEPTDSVSRQDARRRDTLREVGRAGQRLGGLRSSLMTARRLIPFVVTEVGLLGSGSLSTRLDTLADDVGSLIEYEAHLFAKEQFLLDATLGLINIDQNDLFRVLTIVSVVGVPPTLIASIYGMNFRYMPELTWTYGYPYGLCMIILSAAVPLIWFRIRRWF